MIGPGNAECVSLAVGSHKRKLTTIIVVDKIKAQTYEVGMEKGCVGLGEFDIASSFCMTVD